LRLRGYPAESDASARNQKKSGLAVKIGPARLELDDQYSPNRSLTSAHHRKFMTININLMNIEVWLPSRATLPTHNKTTQAYKLGWQ
jgi:hypothetical protein